MAMIRRLEETRPTGHGRARGLVSNRRSGHRVEAHSYAPSETLGDVVATFWAGRWDLRGQPPHVTELLGDPCVHFVFEDGGPEAGSRIVGVWIRLWRRVLQGRGQVRGVKLRAGASRAFLRTPAGELTNRIVPLDAVFGPQAKHLERIVLASDDDAEAFGILSDWLSAHRLPDDGQIALTVELVARIATDPEITSVERLAAVSGIGPRGLQRLFREHVGAAPKWVIRRNRLQNLALRIERGERTTLTALAAELGYSDQAHLTRDFKSIVGQTPSEFAAAVRGSAYASPIIHRA